MDDIENMIPWERLVYVDLIAQKMKEEEMERQDAQLYQQDIGKLLHSQQRKVNG